MITTDRQIPTNPKHHPGPAASAVSVTTARRGGRRPTTSVPSSASSPETAPSATLATSSAIRTAAVRHSTQGDGYGEGAPYVIGTDRVAARFGMLNRYRPSGTYLFQVPTIKQNCKRFLRQRRASQRNTGDIHVTVHVKLVQAREFRFD
jgi:hypothetical protein